MNYIISESQLQLIIENKLNDRLTETMQDLNDFAKKTIQDVLEAYKLNFKFLLTWGASIGGMIAPLSVWLQGEYPDLSSQEVSLLVLGAIAQYYYDNERKIKSLYKKIKELDLETEFNSVKDKASLLKDVFQEFLVSVGITTSSLINTMSYAFLIPILEDLYKLIHGTDITTIASLITKRLVASGVMLIAGTTLSNVIKKLVKRFK